MRVLSYDVGGNFGTRNRVFVEFALVLWAARKLGRPVKFTATRSEAFLSDYQGRDLVSRVELALRKDGQFLAMRATNISNLGARCVSLSPLSKGAGLVPGSYAIPAATLRAMAVFTNTMPTNAYRSSGRPEVTFVIERLIDIAAADLGFDRIELRRKNLISPDAMPYRNAVGMRYDSGRYRENMDWAMEIADWTGFEERKHAAAKRGKLLGRGLANYVESSIGAPNEQARISVRPQRRVDVVIGTQPSGQGHETSFAQVISDLLQVPVETVNLILGDTDVVKAGGGSHSGRSMRHAATVFAKALPELIAKGKRIAAIVLGTAPDRIEFDDGRFGWRDTNRSFDFLELAEEAARHELPEDLKDGIAVVTDNEMHDPVFPNGCAACEVEIDPETGEVRITRYASVDDVGRCINPLIVHGQTHGAIAQGIGQAMWEQCFVEPDSGQPLVGSLMDYGMPRADTVPPFRTEIAEVLSPTNPLGIKAGGEGGTTAAPAVIVSAIVDALADYGVRDIKMPATPYNIWRTIRDAQAKHGEQDMPLMSGGDAVVRSLLGHGISTIYCLPGVQSDHLFNAMFDVGDALDAVHTRHEQGAAYMALGAALATGKPAVYSVVPGPGFLNSSAALATAYSTGARVLALVGQIPGPAIGKGHGFLHEIPDQLGILRTLTKAAERADRPPDAPGVIARAFKALRSGRPRPVGVEVPPDMLAARAEIELCPPLPPDPEPPLDEDAIEQAADLLAKAECPVIFVGGGALEAAAEVRALAERLTAPVVAYRRGKGVLDDRHPLSHAFPGGHALWPKADVVLAVGDATAASAQRLGHRRQAQDHQGRHRPRRARPHPHAGDRPRRRCGVGAQAPCRASRPFARHAAGPPGAQPRAQGADRGRRFRRAGAAGRVSARHPRRAAR